MSRSEETAWEVGWEGHERQQLRRLSRQPLADKLHWLERAHRLVRHLQGRPRLISRRRGISPGR